MHERYRFSNYSWRRLSDVRNSLMRHFQEGHTKPPKLEKVPSPSTEAVSSFFPFFGLQNFVGIWCLVRLCCCSAFEQTERIRLLIISGCKPFASTFTNTSCCFHLSNNSNNITMSADNEVQSGEAVSVASMCRIPSCVELDRRSSFMLV